MNTCEEEIIEKELYIYILVPSLVATGPIKGAMALANCLSDNYHVTIVSLKSVPKDGVEVDVNLKIKSLSDIGWLEKIKHLRKEYIGLHGRCQVVSISYCFSADLVNFLLKDFAKIISSVRANLLKNYYYDYGVKGKLAAVFHFAFLHRFDLVVAMSNSMKRQLSLFGLRRITLIRNFIDEHSVGEYRLVNTERKGDAKFIFLASLSSRKRPELLIDTMHKLKSAGMSCSLDIVGEGTLRERIEEMILYYKLSDRVFMRGMMKNPYLVLQDSDCLVLPSESEGTSRAVMESLFLGRWCLVREVDGNNEIIKPRVNGMLFSNDDELFEKMKWVINNLSEVRKTSNKNLLPEEFGQEENVRNFVEVLNNG